MTLTAIAKQLNTTTMTIYRRLKRAEISIDSLRDANTGEITPAGASIIASLFDAVTQDQEEAQTVTPPPQEIATEVLQAKLDAAHDVITRLEEERERLLRQLDAVNAALEREQADRQHERQLLTGGSADGQQRRGLFGWLRRKQ